MHHESMLSVAKTELRQKPEENGNCEDRFPAETARKQQHRRRENQENNVHRQNIQQRRTVNQQQRFDHGLFSASDKIKIEQIVQAGPVAAHGDGHRHQEGECEQHSMVEIQANGAAPEFQRHRAVAVMICEAVINSASEQRRKKNKSFGGRNKTKGLVDVMAGGGRQVGQRDPHQHHAARCV